MMEQDQLTDVRCRGDLASHRDGRVSIPLRWWKALHLPPVMFIPILGIMDEHVRILRELHQPAVRANVAFGVCCIYNRPAAPRDPVDVDAAGMCIRSMNPNDQRPIADVMHRLLHVNARLVPENDLGRAHRFDMLRSRHLLQAHRKGFRRLVLLQYLLDRKSVV